MPIPRSVTVTILIDPSTALFLTGALIALVFHSTGTGIKSVDWNLIISVGLIVKRYFQIYPSPLLPAALGSKSVNNGWSNEGLPFGLSGFVPFWRH